MQRTADLPELWGGVECTLNRVGDRYHDQLRRSQHLTRATDIDRFAALGLRALRVPLLWERAQPAAGQLPNFDDVDPMLLRVRSHGLRTIAGLCHHGSGPAFTNLLDPRFEHGLAQYARQVAERYPWIEDYTVVNEPLTTARFSALYGHWYPHARDTRSFLRALLHECRATIRAMQAIRAVQPRARLVQTEDIAMVHSTPRLAYQAAYENERRFLSFDLLSGRVDAQHPLYRHLLHEGVSEAELLWFQEHACAPDLIGINYYFTSDRYLDERLDRYPVSTHGGNGRQPYADVEAVRVPGVGLAGHRAIAQAVWDRYRIPIAFTEVHAGCTREEQLRWLSEAWSASRDARQAGVDLRAVTLWALLGSYDWNSLVRVEAGRYEPGVFDLRSAGEPRPTAIATMAHALAHSGSYEHPSIGSPGWWRRTSPAVQSVTGQRPIVITGGNGNLARCLARACEGRGLAHRVLARHELDIAESRQVRRVLRGLRPWALINAACYVHIDAAERAPARCQRENARGPAVLAEACARDGVRLLTFSSDQVFDGSATRPYVESDAVNPVSVYGASQAEAERRVLELAPDAFVVRTSALMGFGERHGILARALGHLARTGKTPMPRDAIVSPTYAPQLVDACLDLLIDGAAGIWHLANAGEVSWAELIKRAAAAMQLPCAWSAEVETAEPTAARPRYSALGSQRGVFMPPLEHAIACYVEQRARLACAALHGSDAAA
jgi:dTDP-4-dehydrorhamnose reductase